MNFQWSKATVVQEGDEFTVIIPVEDEPHRFGRTVRLARCDSLQKAHTIALCCSMSMAAWNASQMLIETCLRSRAYLLEDEPTIGVISYLSKKVEEARKVLKVPRNITHRTMQQYEEGPPPSGPKEGSCS